MFRKTGLILVSLIPLAKLRICCYKLFFGFDIGKNARIAMLNFLDIKTLVMGDNAEIRGFGNIFMSINRLEMQPFSKIGAPRVGLNLFRGTANKKDYPQSVLKIGNGSAIELFHYFDLCGDIIIGDNVIIGGIKSVFFTHTFHKQEFKPIVIGSNSYIGTNCLFQMGVVIPEDSIVAMGSVVTKRFEQPQCLIAGVPAKIVKTEIDHSQEEAFKLRNKPFFKDGEFVISQ